MANNPFGTGIDQVNKVQINYSTGFSKTSLVESIGATLELLFSVSAVLALFVIAYSGIRWFNSGGENEKAQEAASMMRYSVLGLLVMMVAYALTRFVFTQIAENIGGVL